MATNRTFLVHFSLSHFPGLAVRIACWFSTPDRILQWRPYQPQSSNAAGATAVVSPNGTAERHQGEGDVTTACSRHISSAFTQKDWETRLHSHRNINMDTSHLVRCGKSLTPHTEPHMPRHHFPNKMCASHS